MQAKTEAPLRAMYRPELDLLPELGHENASYYQSLIGVLCWIVELGQVDISGGVHDVVASGLTS